MTTAPETPRAVLWDMDGTLVDTEPYWMRAETELVASFGGAWSDEDALTMVGSGLWDSAERLRTAGVDLTADAIVRRLTERVREQLATEPVPWRPGALQLLTELHERGVPCALVTMSLGPMARQVAEALDFVPFAALVTGDTVTHPKPHPEPYLRGAEALGIPAGSCVAIEDSVTGLASATAAGTLALGVPHIVPLPEGDSHTIWPTLEGRTVADLAALTSRNAAVRR